MWEGLRKIGFVAAVIIASAAVYLVFYAEKEVQQDVLDYSLNLLGARFLAMVPDGPEKEKLAELYEGFKQQAVQRNVPFGQIENVAANILNVSNSETALTAQQAEGVLRSAMMAPKPASPATPQEAPLPKELPAKREAPESKRWAALGKRLKTMFEFNENMQKAMKENAAKQRELAKQMRYQAKEGLKLALDADLKTRLDEKGFKHLASGLEKLEKEQLLDWKENLAEEIEREMAVVKEELTALQESLEEMKNRHAIEALQELESLQSLEQLQHVPPIDPDSIRKVVEKSLREAGIPPREK